MPTNTRESGKILLAVVAENSALGNCAKKDGLEEGREGVEVPSLVLTWL